MPTLKLGSTTAFTESSGVITASSSVSTGGIKSMQVFTTVGANTWTRPSGINTIKVTVVGGGGGGGWSRVDTNGYHGGGGSGGGTSIKIIDVSSISSVTATIGAGGIGSGNSTRATSGGLSSFGSHCTATGGGGGGNANGNIYTFPPGVGSLGDINLRGTGGQTSMDQASESWLRSSQGGSSFLGGAGAGGGYSNTGPSTPGYGAGGAGGAGNASGGSTTGQDGALGVIMVEEYS